MTRKRRPTIVRFTRKRRGTFRGVSWGRLQVRRRVVAGVSARHGRREIVRKTCDKINRPSGDHTCFTGPRIVHKPIFPLNILFRPRNPRPSPTDRVVRAIISTTEQKSNTFR